MPRTKVESSCRLEYLSILDEHGTLDAELEPELSTARLCEMHRVMLRVRSFTDRLRQLPREEQVRLGLPLDGHEATQIGAAAATGLTDWMLPSNREIAALMWRGASMSDLLPGQQSSPRAAAKPAGSSAVSVGTQVLHAAGLAYGFAQQGSDAVVMAFINDAAASQDDFREALSFATTFGAPLVLVSQSAPGVASVARGAERPKTALGVALAYEVPCLRADGNDVLAVYAACREAVERSRQERLPALVECVAYRVSLHDPSDERLEPSSKACRQHDPLRRFQSYLESRQILRPSMLRALQEEADMEVTAALEGAGISMDSSSVGEKLAGLAEELRGYLPALPGGLVGAQASGK